jgi:CBS domain containing-hemolysin-like protein
MTPEEMARAKEDARRLIGVVSLEDALYPPLFLKPDEDIANAFQLFRKARRPMALVRDAQRTILALITLEDVLEEVVGDIEDEHDLPIPKLAARKKRQWGRCGGRHLDPATGEQQTTEQHADEKAQGLREALERQEGQRRMPGLCQLGRDVDAGKASAEAWR